MPVAYGGNQFENWERAERCRWQMQRGEREAAVEKIEDQRKPDDFFGHRNRMQPLKTEPRHLH